jgi:hypothetical protein
VAEAESVVLEILKKLQAGQSRLEARVDALMVMQEDIRMIRAAVNDIAAVNVTSGEISSIHYELNQLKQRFIELDGRLHVVEEA